MVVLENLARLLHPCMRWVLEIITNLLEALPYAWYRGVVCPSQLGGQMGRARLFWVGILHKA